MTIDPTLNIRSPLAAYFTGSDNPASIKGFCLTCPNQGILHDAISRTANLGKVSIDPTTKKELVQDQDVREHLCAQITQTFQRNPKFLEPTTLDTRLNVQIPQKHGPHNQSIGEAILELVEGYGHEKSVQVMFDKALEIKPEIATLQNCFALVDNIDEDRNPRRAKNRNYALKRILESNPDYINPFAFQRKAALNSLPQDEHIAKIQALLKNQPAPIRPKTPLHPQTHNIDHNKN